MPIIFGGWQRNKSWSVQIVTSPGDVTGEVTQVNNQSNYKVLTF